jgi:hypothetical protein
MPSSGSTPPEAYPPARFTSPPTADSKCVPSRAVRRAAVPHLAAAAAVVLTQARDVSSPLARLGRREARSNPAAPVSVGLCQRLCDGQASEIGCRLRLGLYISLPRRLFHCITVFISTWSLSEAALTHLRLTTPIPSVTRQFPSLESAPFSWSWYRTQGSFKPRDANTTYYPIPSSTWLLDENRSTNIPPAGHRTPIQMNLRYAPPPVDGVVFIHALSGREGRPSRRGAQGEDRVRQHRHAAASGDAGAAAEAASGQDPAARRVFGSPARTVY